MITFYKGWWSRSISERANFDYEILEVEKLWGSVTAAKVTVLLE